jgi:hypothetical protein
MVKTQVQIPDHLYKEAKRIAAEYEMSFAEVVRRGIEKIAPAYPPRKGHDQEWSLPKPRALGFRNLTNEELKDAAQMTASEEQLAQNRRHHR